MLPNQRKQHETPKHEYVIRLEARNPLAASQWHLWGFGTPAQAEDGSRKKSKDTKKDFPGVKPKIPLPVSAMSDNAEQRVMPTAAMPGTLVTVMMASPYPGYAVLAGIVANFHDAQDAQP